MFVKTNLIPMLINLQLFAEGTGGDGGTGAEGTSGEGAVAAVPQSRAKNNNPLADVKYGIQEDDAQAANVQSGGAATPEADRNAEFEKLIKGEYKDLYDAKMQDTIQKRLKGTKDIVEKYNALTPMFEALSSKYGVDASDPEAIMKAIEEDDSYYEDEALEKGISVAELKRIRQIERENADLKQQMSEEKNRERANQLYKSWMEQADSTKSVYPQFDLETEMQNPRFVDLLRNNVDVRTAYEVMHKDDIIHGAMQFAVNTTKQKVANNIRANGARPIENGSFSQSAAQVKSDVSQLSKADRQEIIRRVKRGEKIRF